MRHKSNTESVVVVLLLRLTFSSVVKHKLFQDTYSAHAYLQIQITALNWYG